MERHVSPVVTFLGVELLDWKKLDNRDTEIFEIGDFLNESGKSAPLRRSYA
jgi:hypothetical protein